MSKYIDQKQNLVSTLSSSLVDNQAFLVFEFSQLNCEDVNAMRKELRALDAQILVRKNNIIERSLVASKIVNEFKLSGQHAVLVSNNINFLPLKTIVDLAKKLDHIKLKMAYFDKVVFEKENLNILSNLKNKEEAIASFAQLLLIPIYKLLFVLKNLKHE